jgi:septum formation inhibitor-activating ATPase MinD
MMSFFTNRDKVSVKDFDKIIGILEQVKKSQK